MKRILLVASLCVLTTGVSFAQKQAVKEAKAAIKSADDAAGAVNNANAARDLITPALTNPETANDPQTWKVAGDIEYKLFDNQRTLDMQKAITKVNPDEAAMYTGLYNMYDPYLKADSLAQIPDAKGKVKNKVRKDIVKKLIDSYKYYVNGGIYYNNKKDFAKAADFFERYWTIPSLPLFGNDNKFVNTSDSTFEVAKYYAVVCAIQSSNAPRAIKLLNKLTKEPYIKNSTFKESDSYELLATEYQQAHDSINYVAALRDGAEKFPDNKYFMPNLINEYIRTGKSDAALEYIDKAIAKDPKNASDLNGVKASLYANQKNYDKAEQAYNDALKADPNNERSLEGLGVLFILKAQDVKELSSNAPKDQQAKFDQQTVDFYQKALVPLEKYRDILQARKADSYDIKQALLKLQNVYYNLGALNVDKSKELNAIDEELKTLQ